MDRYFSGITALRYLRTPPQVLALYPPLAEPYQDSNHMKLASSPLIEDILHTPLDCTVFHANKRRSSKYYRYHLSNTDLPFGCFRPCNHGCYVASPPYALLTSAAFLTETQLLMLAFEFCGTYSVYSPRTRTEKLLQDAYAKRAINPTDGWNRVCSATGKASNLWKREPLTTPDELLAFCTEARGLAGAKRLRRVASLVTGVCASPFEAQASILLGLPRRLGGQGYHFNNNHRIELTTSAQAIYPHTCCYADIFFEATDEHPALDIECQGRSVHDNEAASISDSNRIAALQSMGIEVIPLTFEQFYDADRFCAILDLIATKLDTTIKPKTERQLSTETNRRHDVLVDGVFE